jgi:gamma-glutamyltranspeptidase/glutathione hydrolase
VHTLHKAAQPSKPGGTEWLHACIEALRLAFTDTRWYIADSEHTAVPVKELLSASYALQRASLLSPACAVVDPAIGRPTTCSDTVSFQVVDAWGNACSFINSNYMGFGTGIVPRGCGFSLQNRGANFSLISSHPNVLAPSKRPYHTIIPGMATWSDTRDLCCSFSVMGGFMQPQGHVQVISNMLDFGLDPQTALDLPRFCITDGSADSAIAFEDGISEDVTAQLKRMGHKLYSDLPVTGYARSLFGRGQIILRDRESGVLWGASDGRGDGCALGW